MSVIMGHLFGAALVEAGVLTQAELNQTRRIVIDAQDHGPVVMYLERYADTRLLNVKTTLEGVEIKVVDKEHPEFIPGSPEAAALLGTDYWIDSEGNRVEVRKSEG